MTIQEFCEKCKITEDQFYGRTVIAGDLRSDVTSIPEGANLTVRGHIRLNSLTSISEGVILTAGNDISLNSLTSLSKGVILTAGNDISLNSLTSIAEGVNLAGWSILLNSLTSISEGVSLMAGWTLWLNSLTSLSKGVTLTAGWNLWLNSLTSIPEGVTLTVGNSICLADEVIHSESRKSAILWENDKYVIAGRVLTEIVRKRGNVYHVRRIASDEIFYLVTDGTFCAHGKSLKEARADLKFKIDAEHYKSEPISADMLITIDRYRAITAACELGIRDWMESVFTEKQRARIEKEGIKAEKLLPLLERYNAYGREKFAELYENGEKR